MDKTTLAVLAMLCWFVNGVFFGMWLQSWLFKRKNRKIEADNSNQGCPLSINIEKFPPINIQKFPVGLRRSWLLDSFFPLF